MPHESDEREDELAATTYAIYCHVRTLCREHKMTQAETMVAIAQVIKNIANEWPR